MKKIFISSDFLMSSYQEQLSNNRWFFDLLQRPLNISTKLSINKFIGFDIMDDKEKFSRNKFFSLSKIECDFSKNQFIFSGKNIKQESIEYLKKFIADDILFVSYELSSDTKYILEKLNITYIDIWLHPVRFYDDILFSFYSNNKEVYNKLSTYDFNKEYFYNEATKIKIQNYKGWKRSNLKIAKNSAVFFGQMLEDKAIYKDNKMLNVLDFKKEILDISNKYNIIYYIRHPYLKGGDGKILTYLKNIKNIKIVNFPSYEILSNDNIKEVFSISSSLLYEAKFFNKKITYFYKPVLNFENNFLDFGYITIFQEFIGSGFWSNVLSPIIKTETNNNNNITYLYKKDKLRDMLNFYWSFKQIDKMEYTRAISMTAYKKIININNKMKIFKYLKENLIKKIKILKHKYKGIHQMTINQKNFINIDNVFNEINKAEVISFDIFDTLLIRPLHKPNDLFIFIEKYLNSINFKYRTYKKFVEYRTGVRDLFKTNINEEIKLYDRYIELYNHKLIYKKDIEFLYNLELLFEENLLKPNLKTVEILNYSFDKNKKIILTSDTFFDEEFIIKILKKHNLYNKIDFLILSSSFNKTKHTGNLFNILIDKFNNINIKPEQILHIGDNKVSDIKNAQNKGINTLYIPSPIDNLKENYYDIYSMYSKIDYPLLRTVATGLIANKYNEEKKVIKNSYFNASPFLFGYGVFGYIFFDFVNSLIRQSIEDKVQVLYFLSRDGNIIKKIYDILAKQYPEAPKSETLYASRRSLSVASIYTLKDIEKLFVDSFNNDCSIEQYFLNKFGIRLPTEKIINFKFSNFSKEILLKKIIDNFSKEILQNAANEREELLKYYKDKELFSKKKIGIVDIGHEGNIQKWMEKLLDKKINGYYFATFDKIKINLTHSVWGYYLNEYSSELKHFYKDNILFFENLFLDNSESFLFIDKGINNFLKNVKSKDNIEFTNEFHNGIIEFNKDFTNILKTNIQIFSLLPKEVLSLFISFVSFPNIEDIKIFKNILVENSFNCKENKFLIEEKKCKIIVASSIVKNFAELLYKEEEQKQYIKMYKIYRKIKKLIFKPKQFFYDIFVKYDIINKKN